ncbi:galactose mutarotase [Sphingomonas sp. CGMCC 1.13654]|uniref:Aldose 1-epimerase n=1 Tax=Sphingomonas chungangi TaxID=2683589 RepID=A0A838LBD9_9SPHN|nr:aldose epimerase family protein [Sphingomonas chungangi]MBA2936180.1 galactose mutarotase [Sphingomonas chungangi]MVW55566.1 galactose-1-epimerase [Sphingomonas chungangi]
MIAKTGTMIALAAALATPALAGTIERKPFGQMPDGTAVEAITLANAKGMRATILTLGASVQSVVAPDRTGKPGDVVLGYDDLAGYVAKPNYFGATVGRVANRIAKGRFTLDGKEYQTPVNDGPNALHGGTKGFDKVVWQVVSAKGGAKPSVTLRYVSPDGDQGYPGTLTATATYSLDDAGNLAVDYGATTDGPTVVNISNHTYWNLDGEGSVAGAMGLKMTIPAAAYTPTDATAIPTGEMRPVAGTPFDFRTPTAIGLRVRDGKDEQLRFGRGYDHNWVITKAKPKGMQLMARVADPITGRVMEVLSDQPGLQFYSGNFLDGTITGKSGHIYREGDAIVLEPQMFPDTPNRPEFGSVRLDPGQTYANHIVFRFSAR